MMKRLSVKIGYCARVSVLENQESRSRIFNLFLGCVNVLRLGCNTRLSAASRNLRCSSKSAGRSDSELSAARNFQRKAQFYLDFVEAENSTGFHAPQEAARILGESINFSRQGQNALRGNPQPTSQPARVQKAAHQYR